MRNVLELVETEELIKILKESNFSILLDENTDIGSKKLLYILVRVNTTIFLATININVQF